MELGEDDERVAGGQSRSRPGRAATRKAGGQPAGCDAAAATADASRASRPDGRQQRPTGWRRASKTGAGRGASANEAATATAASQRTAAPDGPPGAPAPRPPQWGSGRGAGYRSAARPPRQSRAAARTTGVSARARPPPLCACAREPRFYFLHAQTHSYNASVVAKAVWPVADHCEHPYPASAEAPRPSTLSHPTSTWESRTARNARSSNIRDLLHGLARDHVSPPPKQGVTWERDLIDRCAV